MFCMVNIVSFIIARMIDRKIDNNEKLQIVLFLM